MSGGGIFIGLGSNMGERREHIGAALEKLAETPGLHILACSRLLETAPVGGPAGQGMFLNGVVEIDYDLGPRALLRRLLEIERGLGRVRRERNGPRNIDLDLLLFRELRIHEPDLTVPHPRMWERAFVLEPLEELCGAARFAALRREFQFDPTEVLGAGRAG